MISIITPIYNTKKYLEECLNSIKNQTFFDFEVLLIDDGSTDGSREIIDKYIKEDSRFKLLGGTHIGFPLAKNLGLDNAKGEYICFLDSDDFLEPTYLELLYKALIENNADIACCGFSSPKNRSDNSSYIKDLKIYREERMRDFFCIRISTFMWNKLFRREIFDDLRFDDVIALSDTMICYKLIERANSIATFSTRLIAHRTHDESMTYRVQHFEPTYWEHRINVYLTMCSYLLEKYPQYSYNYKSIFKGEFLYNIREHISKELFNYYYNREDVKKLL